MSDDDHKSASSQNDSQISNAYPQISWEEINKEMHSLYREDRVTGALNYDERMDSDLLKLKNQCDMLDGSDEKALILIWMRKLYDTIIEAKPEQESQYPEILSFLMANE